MTAKTSYDTGEPACGRQVWNLKPHVKLAVDPMLARLALAEKPTIGFHVRGGDKLQEDKIGCAAAPTVPGAAGRCMGAPADPVLPTLPVQPGMRASRPQEPHDHAGAPLHRRIRGREAAPGQAGACEPPRSARVWTRHAWRYEHGEAEHNPLPQSAACRTKNPDPTRPPKHLSPPTHTLTHAALHGCLRRTPAAGSTRPMR